MANQPQKRAADFTGKQTEKLTVAKAEELKKKQQELSMLQDFDAAQNSELVDYSNGPAPKPSAAVSAEIVVKEKFKIIRINEDIEQMTFGRADGYNNNGDLVPGAGDIRHYDFSAGREYKVPYELYEHLHEIGYC